MPSDHQNNGKLAVRFSATLQFERGAVMFKEDV
jgi:hypothetical protein